MRACVILNPMAHQGKAEKNWPRAEQALLREGVDFILRRTERPGHGIELGYQAAKEGFSPIIAAGGDGTVNEVVNGLMRAKSEGIEVPLGVIPLGTANDLTEGLGHHVDIETSASIIKNGLESVIDICCARSKGESRFFIINSSIGIVSIAAIGQANAYIFKGMTGYQIAALSTLIEHPSWDMKLEWEGGSCQENLCLVTLGKTPNDAGFYLTPSADLFDGMITFVYARQASRSRLIKIFQMAKKAPGPDNWINAEEVEEKQSPWLKVSANHDISFHVDGELFTRTMKEVEYVVLPKALRVIAGPRDMVGRNQVRSD
ncbi:MAG: diacylglycerol kinase family protein [Methanomassiliicoccales archaeon]